MRTRPESSIQRGSVWRSGWTPEWYEDAEGHKSAMHEKNRPGWMALKARLDDPDVVALVANDLSRLHRKGWRIGDLLDFVDQKGIKLVLADPSKHIDFSTPQGRLFAQLSAIFDEWYAMDVSLRRKANIAYRKSKNITVGLPLFGTKRNKDGYLMPTDEGAWLLPNGSWQAGTIQDESPAPEAIWRGYYDCAFRIMELYVTGLGRARVCSIMQSEGWAFRDRYGQPSPLEVDDVRRVTSSWPEYGGAVLDKKSSTRNYREIEPNDVPLDADRAVFDIHLLRRVGEIIRDRSFSMPDTGRNKSVMAYALSGLVYCAGCERIAVQQDNVRLRSKLSGIHRDSYRHRPGLHCDCQRRAVPSKLVEGDFLRLVQNLTLAPEFIEPMLNLAALLSDQPADERDFESKRTTAIARARKRLDAARHIFEDGDISREEYVSRKEKLEREITHWQNYTTETQRTTSELMVAIEAVNKIARLWEGSNDEDRYHMARNLVEYVVYDLDERKVVDFRLKPWSAHFMVLRTELKTEGEEGYGFDPGRIRERIYNTPNIVTCAVHYFAETYHAVETIPPEPLRNDVIRHRYSLGELLSALAHEYELSPARISQIVNARTGKN